MYQSNVLSANLPGEPAAFARMARSMLADARRREDRIFDVFTFTNVAPGARHKDRAKLGSLQAVDFPNENNCVKFWDLRGLHVGIAHARHAPDMWDGPWSAWFRFHGPATQRTLKNDCGASLARSRRVGAALCQWSEGFKYGQVWVKVRWGAQCAPKG